jgi:Zn-finger nucleic acid-binding protein
MKCPICKDRHLLRVTLETNLPAHQCDRCQGIWLSSVEYLAWLRTHGPLLPEKPPDDTPVPTWDTQELKLCPDCGRILSRFRVLPDVRFYLDHCGTCNGVWFDKDEWNVLVSRNLHDKVNWFFTQSWQAKVKGEERKDRLDKLYLEKFGAADYAKIQEVWAWLRDHPQRSMLLAYLQAENPYKI